MKKRIQSFLMMMLLLVLSIQAQVKFPEYIEHVDPTLALVDQEQIRGHHWSVIDVAARNAIPEDKREIGMLVTWIESSTYVTKRFQGINTVDATWVNDINWTKLISAVDTITYADTAIYVKNLIAVDSINFNGTSREVHTDGNIIYDTISRSLQFQNDIVDFNHNLGYELVSRVYNMTGSTIVDGSVVRLVGNYKDNGRITPKIRLAGNSNIDSTMVLGMATVDIPTNSYGIVTLRGELKGLNTASCSNDSCMIYLGYGGIYVDTIPGPPNYAVNLGQVFYADADSGRIFFNPTLPSYSPSPHISGDTSRYSMVLPIITIGTFEYLPISDTKLEDIHGFTLIGDSIRVEQHGHITVALNLSYTGNAQSDIWRTGIFDNGLEINSNSRSTTSTSVGNSTVIATFTVEAGDYISFKMTNESADRDPIINDLSFELIYLHE